MRAPRKPSPPRTDPLERHIQDHCTDLMVLDGWRHLRTDPVSDRASLSTARRLVNADTALSQSAKVTVLGILAKSARGKGFGEPGMCDDLFIRYSGHAHPDCQCSVCKTERARPADVLWVEFKRLGETARLEQRLWHEAERRRGALVLVAGDPGPFGFAPSIEGFKAKIRELSLVRNASLFR